MQIAKFIRNLVHDIINSFLYILIQRVRYVNRENVRILQKFYPINNKFLHLDFI